METQSGTYNDMDALEAPLTAGTAAPNPLENTIQTYQQQAESEYNSERGSAGLSADEALRRLEEVEEAARLREEENRREWEAAGRRGEEIRREWEAARRRGEEISPERAELLAELEQKLAAM